MHLRDVGDVVDGEDGPCLPTRVGVRVGWWEWIRLLDRSSPFDQSESIQSESNRTSICAVASSRASLAAAADSPSPHSMYPAGRFRKPRRGGMARRQRRKSGLARPFRLVGDDGPYLFMVRSLSFRFLLQIFL